MTEPQAEPPSSVQCRANRDPAVRLFITAAMLLAVGVLCYRDKDSWPAPDNWQIKNINAVGGYLLNNFGPFLLIPGGMVAAAWAVVFLRRVLAADGEGIGYVNHEKIAWSQVEKLDAADLKTKGILHLHYGAGRRLTLDSWKLSNFRDLVAIVERHVPAEKRIIG
jgi:hypothetical protein